MKVIMIDFNGMSTHLGLFYVEWLGKRDHCTFIFTFYKSEPGIKGNDGLIPSP